MPRPHRWTSRTQDERKRVVVVLKREPERLDDAEIPCRREGPKSSLGIVPMDLPEVRVAEKEVAAERGVNSGVDLSQEPDRDLRDEPRRPFVPRSAEIRGTVGLR